jgi:hypothetical protein
MFSNILFYQTDFDRDIQWKATVNFTPWPHLNSDHKRAGLNGKIVPQVKKQHRMAKVYYMLFAVFAENEPYTSRPHVLWHFTSTS